MSRILLTTTINAPIETCFDASRNIDVHQHSMNDFNEKAIAGITSGLISNGESVTWRAKHFGLNLKMTVSITDMDPPHSFTDEMTNGPFKKMRHKHIFKEVSGATVMKDIFEFESPLGIAGKLINRLFLENYMRKLLISRNAVVKHYAEQIK